MRKKVFASIVLLVTMLFAVVGWAEIYYVSSSIGDDNNTGTSPSSPWAHHPWDLNATSIADSTSLQPGDVVYLYMGDSWYNVALVANSSGNEGNYIITTCTSTFGDGSGKLPFLSGALNPSILTWIADGSSYKCEGITTAPKAVYYNDLALTENDGATNTVGLNEWDWDSNTLWINIGDNPTGKNIYVCQQNTVFKNDSCNYIILKRLRLEHSNSDFGVVFVKNSNHVKVIDCTIGFAPRDVVYLNGASLCQLIGCAIHSAPRDGIWLYNSNNNTIERCEIYNVWNHKPYPDSTGNGVRFQGSSESNVVRYCIIHDNRWGVTQNIDSGNGGNKVYYNLFYDQVVNTIDTGTQSSGAHFEVINNTIFHNPRLDKNGEYTGHGIVCQSYSNNYSKIANNLVFVNKIGPNCQGIVIANTYDEVLLDYNCVYGINGAHLYKLGTTNYDTLSDWQTAVQADSNIKGLDGNSSTAASHSIASDPLLTNNYHLSRNSPCIDAGIKLPIHDSNWRDLAGNRIRYGTAPDIGCYEYKTWPTGAWGMLPWVGNSYKVQWTSYE